MKFINKIIDRVQDVIEEIFEVAEKVIKTISLPCWLEKTLYFTFFTIVVTVSGIILSFGTTTVIPLSILLFADKILALIILGLIFQIALDIIQICFHLIKILVFSISYAISFAIDIVIGFNLKAQSETCACG